MRRRGFIGLLLGAITATLTKFEFVSALPFIRRKRVVPECTGATQVSGTAREGEIVLPFTRQGDVVVLMLLAVHKARMNYRPKSRLGWTLLATDQLSPYAQYTWYLKADEDLPAECVRFSFGKHLTQYSAIARTITGVEMHSCAWSAKVVPALTGTTDFDAKPAASGGRGE